MSDRNLVHVCDSAGKRIKYLYERDGSYYFYGALNGTRYKRRCPMSTKQQAIAWVKAFAAASMNEQGMALIESTRMRTAYPTIDEVVAAYRAAALRLGEPLPHTVEQNVGALRIVLTDAGHPSPGDCRASVLSAATVRAFAQARLATAGTSMADADRTRRSIASALAKARSLFSRVMLAEAYQGMTLPDVGEFKSIYLGRVVKKRYELPDQAVINAVVAAGKALTPTDPIYPVWIMAYHLGMRGCEIAAARWSWIAPHGEYQAMWIQRRPHEDFAPKGRAGCVPMAPAVYQALLACHRPGDDYILPGATLSERDDLVKRTFAAWMRAHGWQRKSCAHELRMYRGHLWRQAYGVDTAHDWLRHANWQTTLDHYSDIKNDRAPLSI